MLNEYIGHGTDLTILQMSMRAIVVFIIALSFIRLGRRAFGMGSSFDTVIGILLGSILSRAVVGASPFVPTIIAAFIIVIIHKLLAWLSVHFRMFGKIVKGEAILIYKDGKLIEQSLAKFFITENDFKESLRHACNTTDTGDIKEAYIERDGRISFIR
ncbi:MAG: YetF domain-containing protein [Bacteroidota bacterium]